MYMNRCLSTYLYSYNCTFLHFYLRKYVVTCIANYVLMSIYKYKEMQLCICFYSRGSNWHLLAVFGHPLHCNNPDINYLLYKNIKSDISMKKLNQYLDSNCNGVKPFFPALLNPSRRADYLFTRTEQVVF